VTWRYLLARLLGCRPGVAHNPVLPGWPAGPMDAPYLVDREGKRLQEAQA
jgi:hypothetical protein